MLHLLARSLLLSGNRLPPFTDAALRRFFVGPTRSHLAKPSRCIFFFNARMACSILLSLTMTCILSLYCRC